MYPSDYRYTKEHEWIKVSGSTGTIGIRANQAPARIVPMPFYKRTK